MSDPDADVTSKIRQQLFGGVGPLTLAPPVGVGGLSEIKHVGWPSSTLTCGLYPYPALFRFGIHGQSDSGTGDVGQVSSFAVTVGGPGKTRV